MEPTDRFKQTLSEQISQTKRITSQAQSAIQNAINGMSRSRYEVVPQNDEAITLDSISSVPGYNYNSGIPNSVPSSAAPSYYNPLPRSSSQPHAPSIHSIPGSPPPSFHTHSSPGTPRPTPSTTAAGDYAELWGVAPSTTGAPTEAFPSHINNSAAHMEILHLQSRIQKLEETIGRLLLEKDEGKDPEEYKGGNCCMSFVDASASLEKGMSAAGGNCCIYFRTSKRDEREYERKRELQKAVFVLCLFGMIFTMVVLLSVFKKKKD